MKITPLNVLLATTFLTTNAIAYTISTDDLGTSQNIKWQEVTGAGENTIKINLPEGVTKYFKYTYTSPTDRTVYNSQQTTLSGSINADFVDSTATSIGGGLYLKNDADNSVTGDFVNNYSVGGGGGLQIQPDTYVSEIKGDYVGNYTEGYGGGIRNAQGKFDTVEGNFIGNSGVSNGAAGGGGFYSNREGASEEYTATYIRGNFISNYLESKSTENGYAKGGGLDLFNASVKEISGNFISNTVKAVGIAYGSGANIGNSDIDIISGDFINNVSEGGTRAGGALEIYNNLEGKYSNVKTIKGNFINNTNISENGYSLGAVSLRKIKSEKIEADFINNSAISTNNYAVAGAITNDLSKIKEIKGIFQDNYAQGGRNDNNYLGAYGGAILNTGYIGSISGKFINNYAENIKGVSGVQGGAIYNYGETAEIGSIQADFEGNYAKATRNVSGGVIQNRNNSVIGLIRGNFTKNYVISEKGNAFGGVIHNDTSKIESIEGDFTGNYSVSDTGNAVAGAIYNIRSTINKIIGDFRNNYAQSNTGVAQAGVINNNNSGYIKKIAGNFINNYAKSNSQQVAAGVLINFGTIENINGNFTNNYAQSSENKAYGGVISNRNTSIIKTLSGMFENNKAISGNSFAQGGAIYNNSTIENILNTSFINNSVSGNEESKGGAIYSTKDITITVDKGTSLFQGNTVNGESNAIYMDGTEATPLNLNLTAKNSGTITFDDALDGQYYNININGDNNSNIVLNNLINNVSEFNISTAKLELSKNAVINISKSYIAKNNPYLRLNVDAKNKEVGQLNIGGNVEGITSIIVNVKNYQDVREEKSLVFATAKNDTKGNETSFSIYRVFGSPYMYEVDYDTTEKTWALAMNNDKNPYYSSRIEVAPEFVAMTAVKTAGLAQTNGMVYNIMRKVGVNRLFCPGCGFYDYNWDGKAFHNAWVDTTYNGLTIEAPVEIDANVWGIEAGSDLQHDLNNKLGIFVSYRQGNYEMDGKGEKYYSTIGSEIDIDSYLAGLYYRYDHNNWYAFATVYGGMQEAEIKTDDGISADTDGIEFGGSIEGGYNYALTRTLSVTPSLGVFYSQINYDDATDSAGKTVEYNDLKQVEIEAGAKFAHTQYTDDGFYSLYIKPSVVQTLIDGDEIDVTELGKVDTIDDKTLGRIEIGGNYGFNDNWSAYGWANYTFGSDYEATSLGIGINYAW